MALFDEFLGFGLRRAGKCNDEQHECRNCLHAAPRDDLCQEANAW